MATESTKSLSKVVLDSTPGYSIIQFKICSKRFSKEMSLIYYKWIDLLPIKLDSIHISKGLILMNT